jgi:gliding motility-associated-like protein
MLSAGAQPDRNNWYFGNRAAISFETGKAVAKFDNPQKIYGPSASISHPVTGKLLFYTDGINVWNSSHQVMTNGAKISSGNIARVLIVPDPVNDMRYYVFYSSYTAGRVLGYVVVDMNENNGAGSVVKSPEIIKAYGYAAFVVVYHPYQKAFWLIMHSGARYESLFFDETGTMKGVIYSYTGLIPKQFGDMVVSHKGDKLVVTHYQGNGEQAEVFDFDKVCGQVSNARLLDKLPNWDRPYGAAFSPDDSKLYITYSYQQSQLIQYYGDNFESNYFVADAPDNLDIIRDGPDGKVYIATHDGGIPGPRIDAILKPNEIAAFCGYTKTYLTTDNGTGRNPYFELPMFVNGQAFSSPEEDSIFSWWDVCLGDTTRFTFNKQYPYDSLVWKFGEGTDSSVTQNPGHRYLSSGTFIVSLTLYKCSTPYVLTDTIKIETAPEIGFPKDTTVCYGTPLVLHAPFAEHYTWSTGATAQSVTINSPGLIWLKIRNGSCTLADSVRMKYYSNIMTALGDLYTICDDDKELVKLDAGEGFTQYKWTPTGDTTQWVIVGDVGKYYVVVKDYRGCDGKDGTKVERRCPVSVFYPNAFTPNNDGLNDVYLPVGSEVTEFQIRIYNAWGQKIFESKKIEEGWDGKINGIPAPIGTYVYESVYSGYRNKHPVSFEVKGNITLVR